MSERQACRLLKVPASSYRYRSRTVGRDEALRVQLTELAQQYPRYGSPRLCVLIQRQTPHNHKLVERIYRQAGLALRRKQRKRVVRASVPAAAAQRANQEWALDFITDALATGRHIRILTVVDVFTRECLALEADTSLGSLRVLRVLETLIQQRGAPSRIRSDNGPEFTSRAYLAWALERRIDLVHIRPGKPIENAYIESFNGRLREECLNVSWFRNLFDARRQLAAWRHHYNHERPHSSLEYSTPKAFALAYASAGLSCFEAGQEGSIAALSPQPPLSAENLSCCILK